MSLDQPSSIPVDRHVFQFAERWYKIKTKGGLKGYEHIADKFRILWGGYAGWAHSVLFTADLRAFSSYKKEEEVKVDLGDEIISFKQEDQLIVPFDVPIKAEEEEIFHDNGRPARVQRKRPLEEHTNTITHTFQSIKKASQHSNQSHRRKID